MDQGTIRRPAIALLNPTKKIVTAGDGHMAGTVAHDFPAKARVLAVPCGAGTAVVDTEVVVQAHVRGDSKLRNQLLGLRNGPGDSPLVGGGHPAVIEKKFPGHEFILVDTIELVNKFR